MFLILIFIFNILVSFIVGVKLKNHFKVLKNNFLFVLFIVLCNLLFSDKDYSKIKKMLSNKDNDLYNIVGGASITGTFLSALAKSVTTIYNLGRSLGSSLRRAISGRICSL